MSIAGKIALVTGGSRGIGRAIALRLAEERPEHVVIAYNVGHAAAAATVSDIERLGVGASSFACDLGQSDSIESLFTEVETRCGRLDLFISNAARASFREALDIKPRTWQRVMDQNALAFLLGCQLAAPLMPNGGRIVALSSLGSRGYAPGYVILGAAKAAIESMVRYLAVELAPRDINVNAVCGGLVRTESVQMHPHYAELEEAVIGKTPAGRVGTPEDLANIVAFLCDSRSDWIRGQTIVADGGYSLIG